MRTWSLKLHADYAGEKNHITALRISEKGEGGDYTPLEIHNGSPGFLIFVYSLLSCQHLYMFTNCAEHGLVLSSSIGDLDLVTTDDWMLTELRVSFSATLASGSASPEIIADIERRMNQCPVSRNIHPAAVHESRLTLSG